jgi:hypothetical protein
MSALLNANVNKNSISVDMEVFSAVCDVAKKHKCDTGTFFGVFLAAGLGEWRPDFRRSMGAIFGEKAGKAIDALHLEGWIGQNGGATRGEPEKMTISTPVDALAAAWGKLTREKIPMLTRKRIYSQMCSLHPGGPVKFPTEAAGLYSKLFPEGSFQSFVNDAYKYPDSFDRASVGARGVSISSDLTERWRKIWTIASLAEPCSKFASDPYVFFCCALNPNFNERLFAKNIRTYSPWDAIESSLKTKKKQPDPTALLSNENVDRK